MRTLILLLAVIAAVYIARFLWQKKGYTSRQITQRLLFYAIGAALLLLIVTGRLPWLLGVIGAAFLAMTRLLPLFRYVPFLHGLYKRYQTGPNNAHAGGGGASSVQSRYLRMSLNHNSGDMDGEILSGSCQGKRLSALPMETVIDLLNEFADDPDSLSLLQAYLDRMHDGWRERAHYGKNNGGQNNSGQYSGEQKNNAAAPAQMAVREAYDILGLQAGASKEQIIAAHRRLMQKLHPDRGGSSYLAAKINNAKEVLIRRGS